MIDGLFGIFFGAGFVSPFFAPTVRTAAAKADKADDFCFFRKARQMRGHRSAGGVAEADDLPSGEVIIRQVAPRPGE